MWLGNRKQGKFIVLGCHGKEYKLDRRHYIAVDAAEGVIIDSARKVRFKLSPYGVLHAMSFGIDKLYCVEKVKHTVFNPNS